MLPTARLLALLVESRLQSMLPLPPCEHKQSLPSPFPLVMLHGIESLAPAGVAIHLTQQLWPRDHRQTGDESQRAQTSHPLSASRFARQHLERESPGVCRATPQCSDCGRPLGLRRGSRVGQRCVGSAQTLPRVEPTEGITSDSSPVSKCKDNERCTGTGTSAVLIRCTH